MIERRWRAEEEERAAALDKVAMKACDFRMNASVSRIKPRDSARSFSYLVAQRVSRELAVLRV